jgi:hypothetical protein
MTVSSVDSLAVVAGAGSPWDAVSQHRAIVDSNCSGLNGFTIQPVAPACLPRCFVSWPDSVVSTSIGVNL